MILNKKKPRFSVVSVDVLQHMVCCNTWLQHMVKCVAVYILCCSKLSVAMCCNVRFLSVAMCCNVLQCVAVDIFKSLDCQYADFPVNSVLRCVAVCCWESRLPTDCEELSELILEIFFFFDAQRMRRDMQVHELRQAKGQVCDALQHTATHSNALRHTATHCTAMQSICTHCKPKDHATTHCNALQHTAL